MRSPLAAFRDFRAEFGCVMREHEAYLLDQLAPAPEAVAAARAHRAGAEATATPDSFHPSENQD